MFTFGPLSLLCVINYAWAKNKGVWKAHVFVFMLSFYSKNGKGWCNFAGWNCYASFTIQNLYSYTFVVLTFTFTLGCCINMSLLWSFYLRSNIKMTFPLNPNEKYNRRLVPIYKIYVKDSITWIKTWPSLIFIKYVVLTRNVSIHFLQFVLSTLQLKCIHSMSH